MSKPKSTYSGATLRQQAAHFAAQADPKAEAERHEQFFLGSMRSAKEHFDWIVDHAAWTLLGFDTFAGWWETRVVPIADVLGMRPTREIAKVVIEKVVEEQKDLPKAQQRTQRQIAAMVGVDKSTVARSTAGANAPESDLDRDPLESFPDVEKALKDFHDNQTSGPGATSPAAGSGENRPGGDPGEAEADHSAADVTTPSATPTDPEAPPASDASGSVNEPERAGAGVSPPAPVSEIPEWLRKVTAVCAAVHDLLDEEPFKVAEEIDVDLAATLGEATSGLLGWYRAMQEAFNEAQVAE